ncbi:MAG: D-aminoacyl-tRNA deacylase [Salibacteraceae bacterium]
MRAVVQRVHETFIVVNEKEVGRIDKGFLILLGIGAEDTSEDVKWLAKKVISLRIFNDHEKQMNLNIEQVDGSIAVVSQFTLHAKYKKGTRPSFIRAANPEMATTLYEGFCRELETLTGKETKTGVFGEHMDVHLINDGPVTLVIDTKNKE